jgi:serine/threonine-protein kinase
VNAPPAALLDARYRLGPVIARGGMSTVFRGTDTRLDRPVAVKVMDPRLAADPVFRARFEREARSAARIHHPAVVGVFDQGEDRTGPEPTVFLVMELVEGGTLREVLRARGPLGVPAALAVLEPVLAGLAQAHRLGLVHRDVKPENVLISRAGEVKVADFGLVVAAAQAGASHVGTILGTVAYLSPEQVVTGSADARSDVYAAGAVLYELLTGSPPFVGDTAISVAYRHVNDRVPAPSLVAGDVPPELDALVAAATDRDPAGRPPDAAAFLTELRHVARVLEVPRVAVPAPPAPAVDDQATVPGVRSPGPTGHRGTRALPAPAPAPSPPPPAHRRPALLATALVAVLALVLGTGWWWTSGRFTEVPALTGVSETQAVALVTAAGLAVGPPQRLLDDAAPAGTVLASAPEAAARLLRGEVVTLTVSSGRPVVPAVAPGTPVEVAEQTVRDAGLTPARTAASAEFSDAVPAGAVVRTDPGPGTAVPIGSEVVLVVSRGAEPPPEPEQRGVPFVIGQRFEEAEEILEDAGFEVEQRDTFDLGPEDRDESTVVGQTPGAGAVVEEGSTVVLDTL